VLAGWIGGLWSAQQDASDLTRNDAEQASTDAAAHVNQDMNSLAFEAAIAAVFVHGNACAALADERLPVVAGALVDAIARALRTLQD
jgi:NAD(P)H-hydrate repair Nnr-like enzyme with NAD(P)H-hydrate dehydratase domain